MALDTAQNRRAAGGVPFLPLGLGVTPDVAKGMRWRREAGWSYISSTAGEHCVEFVDESMTRITFGAEQMPRLHFIDEDMSRISFTDESIC